MFLTLQDLKNERMPQCYIDRFNELNLQDTDWDFINKIEAETYEEYRFLSRLFFDFKICVALKYWGLFLSFIEFHGDHVDETVFDANTEIFFMNRKRGVCTLRRCNKNISGG